jgi:hypothetical protein
VAGEGGFEPSELVAPELAADGSAGNQTRRNGQSTAVTESGRKESG